MRRLFVLTVLFATQSLGWRQPGRIETPSWNRLKYIPRGGGDTQDTEEDDPLTAGSFRTKGKELHDQGKFIEAAALFAQAAQQLDGTTTETEELATCKLHEALCRLKAEDYENAQEACTYVIELDTNDVAPALRARAFHRRAKARLELNETDAALEDARSAAFLGDRKAVALYGKLMRESPASSSSSSLFDGNDPFSSSLLESLLTKSPSDSSSSPGMDSMFPASLFGSGMPSSNMGGSLAKSVISSLTKRIEDESTQETICEYLQGTSGPQLQQMASMAGVQLGESMATKIANFCHSVTPKLIRKVVRIIKRLTYVVKLVRKFFQVLAKYRSIIIIVCILMWTKSAILRPVPVSKRAARLAAKTQ